MATKGKLVRHAERTLVLAKPDAVQRGLAGTVLSRLEARGLKIVALRMLRMDRGLAGRIPEDVVVAREPHRGLLVHPQIELVRRQTVIDGDAVVDL